MATTLPLVIFVLATTGLSIITLIGFVFSDWHAGHQPYSQPHTLAKSTASGVAELAGTAQNDGRVVTAALKAAA